MTFRYNLDPIPWQALPFDDMVPTIGRAECKHRESSLKVNDKICHWIDISCEVECRCNLPQASTAASESDQKCSSTFFGRSMLYTGRLANSSIFIWYTQRCLASGLLFRSASFMRRARRIALMELCFILSFKCLNGCHLLFVVDRMAKTGKWSIFFHPSEAVAHCRCCPISRDILHERNGKCRGMFENGMLHLVSQWQAVILLSFCCYRTDSSWRCECAFLCLFGGREWAYPEDFIQCVLPLLRCMQ